ncbi:site-specific recombination directionality factor RDF [Mycobacterium phage Backyardigan]|uniref:Uncharacterized protein n=1 Tax=Mycobacterium phage Backyardigan TaxID=2902881 RepID=G1BL45_9CAUD|nr:site-specific recombination directionality factor RDF [Mycobacterium phage Backyardigan]QAY06980.1 hypothetical protein SEA_DATWAY_74 [Mycobacterium phage Datway]QCW22723.1 hypothetical protein SEA_XENA_73 [Mycobacterium phage Xena]QFP95741.1 hypothetical protein SEA_ABBYSRANGER_74 [Mycobacterium phage AbbysRanger]QXN74549.1 membrane protein [Mycobacterium Phage PetiteSangsue]WAB09397.1 membrane protein [Mycobacterium phage Perplexer]
MTSSTLAVSLRGFAVAAVVAAGLVGITPTATATAEVSAECWAHLGDVSTANTPAADRRFHLERGEFSPCTEADANESLPKASSDSKPKEKDRDKKSRHCRKHWYC